MTTNTTHPQPAARIETLPYVATGDVVTAAGTDYYVAEAFRGSLELVRLHDLTTGFKANTAKHRIESPDDAVDERCRHRERRRRHGGVDHHIRHTDGKLGE